MPITNRTVVFADDQTITSDISVICPIPEWATAFVGFCSIGGGTGTSPTLNVEIYQIVRTPVAADTPGLEATDNIYANHTALGYGQLTQFTTPAATRIFGAVGGGNYEAASGLPAAGTWRNGPIGAVWKVTFNVGGTNPSYTNVKMSVQFAP